MSETTADVLIIGAGASGAALAWSLAETRMNIVCLEQGDWVQSTDLPGIATDWEVRQAADFNFSPNTRGRREDYPVNDSESPISFCHSSRLRSHESFWSKLASLPRSL